MINPLPISAVFAIIKNLRGAKIRQRGLLKKRK